MDEHDFEKTVREFSFAWRRKRYVESMLTVDRENLARWIKDCGDEKKEEEWLGVFKMKAIEHVPYPPSDEWTVWAALVLDEVRDV